MSIMRFCYLFWLTNWGRCVQPLALEIRGEKVVLEGWWWNIASKQ